MKLRVFSSLLLCLIALPYVASAQGLAQITGTVKDQMNTNVAGAEVVAAEIERGIDRHTVTDRDGSYFLPNSLISSAVTLAWPSEWKRWPT